MRGANTVPAALVLFHAVAVRAVCEQRVLSYTPHFTARVSCAGFRGACDEIGDDADAFVAAAVPYDLWDASVSDFEPEGCRVDRHEHDLFGRDRGPGPRQLAGVRLSAPCAALETVAFTLNGTALVEPVRFPLFMGLGFANHTETLWSNAAWFHAGPTMFEFLTSCRVVGFFSVALVLVLFICLCLLCSWRCRGSSAYIVRVDDESDDSEFSSDDEEAPNRQLMKTAAKKKKPRATKEEKGGAGGKKKKKTKKYRDKTGRAARKYHDGGNGNTFEIGSDADVEGDCV